MRPLVRRIQTAFVAAFAFCLLVSNGGLTASTVDPPTLRQMVQRADRIFVGQVTAVRSYWTGPSIHTDVTFRSTLAIKGSAGPVVMLTFLGGTVGDVTLEVTGMPQFEVGDEQVLFATDRLRQMSPLVGVWHGRVIVSRDPRTQTARVLRHDRTPFDRAAAVTERAAAASPTMIIPMTLDAFLDEVRELIREGRQ